jgi:hypothetical protein
LGVVGLGQAARRAQRASLWTIFVTVELYLTIALGSVDLGACGDNDEKIDRR